MSGPKATALGPAKVAGFSPLYPYSSYYGGFGGGFYQNRYSTPYFGMTGSTAYFDDYDSPPAPPYIVRLSGEFPATLILEFPAPATVWLNDKEVPGTPDAVRTISSPVLRPGEQ